MISRKGVMISAVTALFLVAVLGSWLYARHLQQTSNLFLEEKLRAANESARALDFAGARRELTEMSAEFRNRGERENQQYTDLLIAFNYNKEGNYETGIPLFKQIILDEAVSPEIKTLGIAMMTNVYYRGRWKEPLQEIFTDRNHLFTAAFGQGNRESLADLEFALKELYENAQKEYPLGYLSYTTALWYAGQALDRGAADPSTPELVRKAESLIAQGDSQAARERQITNSFPLQNFRYHFGYTADHYRFVALTFLARLDQSVLSKTQESYGRLMARYQQRTGNTGSLVMEGFTRFYYVALMATLYERESPAILADILTPVMHETGEQGKANALSLWLYFERELNRPVEERGHNQDLILKTASVVPEFDEFLVSKGWKQ